MAETVGMKGVVKLYFYKMLPDTSPMKSQDSLREGIRMTKAFLKVKLPIPQGCNNILFESSSAPCNLHSAVRA